MRFERYQRILAPQVNHAIVISRLRNRTCDERMPQAPQLVAIQVVHELEDQFGTRCRCRADAVQQELLEDLWPVSIRHHRRVPGFGGAGPGFGGDEPGFDGAGGWAHDGCLT